MTDINDIITEETREEGQQKVKSFVERMDRDALPDSDYQRGYNDAKIKFGSKAKIVDDLIEILSDYFVEKGTRL